MRAISAILNDRALSLVALAFLTHGAFAASLVPYRSLLAVEWFGFSNGTFALVHAAGSTLSLVCAIGVGILTDRTGRRRNAARLAALAGAGGAALVFFADARWAFVVAHVLLMPVGMTLFSQLFTLARLGASTHPAEDRAAIQSAIRAIFAVPFVAILPIWSVILSTGAPLLWIYAACAVAETLTLAIFVLAWPRDGRTRWADPKSGLRIGAALKELAEPRVMARTGLLAGVLSGVQMYLILAGLILTGIDGRDAGDVAIFAGAVAGLEIPFMLAMGAPLRRLGPVRLIAAAAAIYAAFLALFPLLGPFPAVWVLPLVAASAAAVILTVPLHYLQDLMADRPGAGGSLIALCNLGAQLLGAAVFALGSWAGGYEAAAWIGAAVVAGGGLGLAALDRRQERHRHCARGSAL
jgi:MFS transporter, SET family, sugar efflux transporter